jgi:hypothetical protein
MKFWKSKDLAACPQNGDTEQVRQKLAACEQGIQAAEVELRTISLQAALSEDPDAGHDAIARLNALRSKRELLTNALQAAEQAERERLAALHAREWQARKRSLAQKTGQLERDAAEVARNLTALQNGIRRMEEAGQSIVALLPPNLRTPARPFHELFSPVVMRDLVRLERYRLGDRSSKPERLGNYMSFQDARTAAVKSMTDVLTELTASVKQGFDAGGLSAPTAAQPTRTPAPESSGVVVSLQGVDAQTGLPKPKVTDGTEAQDEEEEAVSADKPQEQGVTADA